MMNNDLLFLSKGKKLIPVTELKGFADLHTHPAAHLAFGGPEDGSGMEGRGLLWGRPFDPNCQDIAVNIPACYPDRHSGDSGDVVKNETRCKIIASLDATACNGFQHTTSGPPSCQSWPHALSVTHQKMHIDWIRRAWEGGLRLMVASAVDSQVFAMLWYRSYGAGTSHPQPGYDLLSAQRQLNNIHEMVNLNADWMQIVKTSSEARLAIQKGKLAVVLGVEMDQLSVDDILQLWDTHDVRCATPIHLVNNSLGGAAIYNQTFNTANQWLDGAFFNVKEDKSLEFRLLPEQQEIRFNDSPFTDDPWDYLDLCPRNEWYDLFSWGAAVPVDKESVYPPCAKSNACPCSYSNDNVLAIAWKGTNSPGRLRWVRRTDSEWIKSFIDDGQVRESNHAPSITFFNNRWYVAWTGTNADHPYIHIMRSTDESGDSWGEHYKLDGSAGRPEAKSRCNPFLLSANGRLSLFWVGTNSPGEMRWTSTTDGINWIPKVVVNDGTTRESNFAPSAAFFNDRYYVAWTDTNNAHPYIHLLKSTDKQGSAWGSYMKFDGTNGLPQAKSSQGPHMLSANGKLHIVWTGTVEGKMRWIISLNGTNWEGKAIIQDWRERHTSFAPSVAFHKDQYHIFWIGKKYNYINCLKSIDSNASRWIHHSKNIGCPGHRNTLGLTPNASQDILKLMKRGFIIDLAHMSQEAIAAMLDLAEQYKYPLVNTHTGVRPLNKHAMDERDMTREHAMRLAKLGGVIGACTGWNIETDTPISDWVSYYHDLKEILGCPPALGTDFNGLSAQIANSEQSVQYPLTGFNNSPFNRLEFGQRKFNFADDGLVTYGMLPDFIDAVKSKAPDTQNQLLSSVQSIINSWVKIESAQKGLDS